MEKIDCKIKLVATLLPEFEKVFSYHYDIESEHRGIITIKFVVPSSDMFDICQTINKAENLIISYEFI